MYRTQVQLPEKLRREAQRIADQQEWSMAEVIRRGLETIACQYPQGKGTLQGISGRPPIKARLRITDPVLLKDALQEDQERM